MAILSIKKNDCKELWDTVMDTYPNLNIKYYANIDKKKLHNCDRLVQTPATIVHMDNMDSNNFVAPHILYIDRIEDMFRDIIMDNQNNRIIMEYLYHYIVWADYLFITDYYFTTNMAKYIRGLREDSNRKVRIINNLEKFDKYTFNILYGFDLNKVMMDISNNLKLFIFCDDLSFAREIFNKINNIYPDISKKLFYEQDDLKNKTFTNFDIVIWNPIRPYVVNFDVEYFDKIYGFIKNERNFEYYQCYKYSNQIKKCKNSVVDLMYIK